MHDIDALSYFNCMERYSSVANGYFVFLCVYLYVPCRAVQQDAHHIHEQIFSSRKYACNAVSPLNIITVMGTEKNENPKYCVPSFQFMLNHPM